MFKCHQSLFLFKGKDGCVYNSGQTVISSFEYSFEYFGYSGIKGRSGVGDWCIRENRMSFGREGKNEWSEGFCME